MRDETERETPSNDLVARALDALRRSSRAWTLRSRLPAEELSELPQAERLQAQILHNRGFIGPAARRALLDRDWRAAGAPSSQLERAAERVCQALRTGERITVFGDFDCDGVCACALLVQALRSVAVSPETITPQVPERDEAGRGLNEQAIRAIAARGDSLIVTCDCGTSNVEEVALAGSLGIEVIVTDHHPAHGPLPAAYAIVNPRIEDESAPQRDLAGAGVAFRLAEAVFRLSAAGTETSPDERPAGDDALTSLLDLVAIGTVGDVAPLSAENWALVRAGVSRLNSNPRPGVRELLASAAIAAGQITARDIGYAIAPRLNAASRMGSPTVALNLLLTRDPYQAASLAAELDILNRRRQQHTEEILLAARAQAGGQTRVIVARGEHWKSGVLGLVAGKLVEEFGAPAFVLSRESGRWIGSARGPDGVDLGAMLARRADFFAHFGGHARAAGFTLATDDTDAFVAYLRDQGAYDAAPAEIISAGESDVTRPGDLEVDGELPLHALRDDHFQTVTGLEPYGIGFPEPAFLATRVRVVSARRSGLARANLRLRLQSGGVMSDAVWSKQGELESHLRLVLSSLPLMDVVYQLARYVRADTGQVERLIRIVAMRPSAEAS